jgi:hypothetical protein
MTSHVRCDVSVLPDDTAASAEGQRSEPSGMTILMGSTKLEISAYVTVAAKDRSGLTQYATIQRHIDTDKGPDTIYDG